MNVLNAIIYVNKHLFIFLKLNDMKWIAFLYEKSVDFRSKEIYQR